MISQSATGASSAVLSSSFSLLINYIQLRDECYDLVSCSSPGRVPGELGIGTVLHWSTKKNVRATKVASHAFKRRMYEIWLIVTVIDLIDFIDSVERTSLGRSTTMLQYKGVLADVWMHYKVVPLYLHAPECLPGVT